MARPRTLFVKRVFKHELLNNGWPMNVLPSTPAFYARCNRLGEFDISKALLYTTEELIEL